MIKIFRSLVNWFRTKKNLVEQINVATTIIQNLNLLINIKDNLLINQQQNINRIMQESIQLLSAITLLNNGTLNIPKDFLEALKEDKSLTLKIQKNDDESVNLELVSIPTQEKETTVSEENPLV